MDRRFAADEWKQLSNAERAKRCETMAREAMMLAENAPKVPAEDYIDLADQWLQLAIDLMQAHTGIRLTRSQRQRCKTGAAPRA